MNSPYTYKVINELNQCSLPNGIKLRDNNTFYYFSKYYFQKILSLYKINQPEEWPNDYILEVLFRNGFVTIFDSNKFGVIPQMCTLNGFNVFYHPREAIITNPLLPDVKRLLIDEECVVIHLPEYSGLCDIVSKYAAEAALAMEALDTSIFNTHFATIFAAEDKSTAKSFYEMVDRVARGEIAVAVGKKLFDETGKPKWLPFDSNGKYMANDIMLTLNTLEQRFNTEIGIPNANLDKRQYLSDDEVNANNIDTNAKCALWLDYIQEGFDKANKKYGLDLSIQFRFNPKDTNGGEIDATRDNATIDDKLEQ